MALLYLEDFEGLTSITQAGWQTSDESQSDFDTSIYYHGTQSYKSGGSYDYITKWIDNINPLIVGFAIRRPSDGGQGRNFFEILGLGLYAQLNMRFQSSAIVLRRYTTVLGTSSTLSDNTWYYVEVKLTVSNSISTDDCIVKIDGVEEINLSATTDTQYCDTDDVTGILMETDYLNKQFYIDNMYICDDTGSDNNDILGMPLIDTLYPNGNGNQNDFVGSDADSTDNYLHVDETIQDEDTSYVESETVNDIDLYALETVSYAFQIYGIAVSSFIKAPFGGAPNFQHVVRTASTNYTGSTTATKGKDYNKIDTIWENNPNDSLPWEKSDIDGLEVGIKVVT